MRILIALLVTFAVANALAASSEASEKLTCGVLYNAENKAGGEVPEAYEDIDNSKLDINVIVGKSATVSDAFVKVQAGIKKDQDGRNVLSLNIWDVKSKVLLSKVKNTVLSNELNLFVRLPDETQALMKKKGLGQIAWAELWCSVSKD
ncbi:hypothetical protein [Bdellovibrio sp. HCB209]|uniref:hypothetical protein n=1 Tax=Bdellovibrio sp. HCB209 TaxID=3394354 RepID=UPI0039B3A98C